MTARDLLHLLVPPQCLVCRAPGHDLCGACRGALPWLVGARCARCGLPAPCGRPCPAALHAYAAAWAPLAHEGPARTLVTALKFRGAIAAADLLAAAIMARRRYVSFPARLAWIARLMRVLPTSLYDPLIRTLDRR